MKNYSLKNDILAGKRLAGIWAQAPCEEVVEVIGYSGYDFAIVDMEHGCIGLETAERMVRASDAVAMPVFVRVLDNQPAMIMKALETGAAGVVVPNVCSVADAEKAVKAAKYAPHGTRGACPFVRSANHNAIPTADMIAQDGAIIVCLLIEGRQAFDDYDAILKIPGVDCVMLGPVDLSFSLGVGGRLDHPKVKEAIAMMAKKGRDAGKPVIANIFHPDSAEIRKQAAELYGMGVNAIICNTDKTALIAGMLAFTEALRMAEK